MDIPESLEEANKNGVAFMVTELDMATTFLDIADHAENREVALKNREDAWKAYATVINLLARIQGTAAENTRLQTETAALRTRLDTTV